MKTIEEIRAEALRSLINQFGSTVALNRSLGRRERDSTFSQILNAAPNSKSGKPKTMGSDLAREIESGLNLERGWMDNSLNASNVVEQNVESVKPMWPFSASYSDYLSLSNIAQKRLNDKVVDFIDGALAAYSHELKKENSKTGTCD